jgi:hypothetical protein
MNRNSILTLLPLFLAIVISIGIAGCDMDSLLGNEEDDDGKNEDSIQGAGGIVAALLTDYQTGSLSVYAPEDSAFSDNVMEIHQDAYAATDGNYLYILEAQGADNIIKIDPANVNESGVVYQYSVGENSNPRGMAFVGAKGYVFRYNTDKIWVVDTDAGSESDFKTGEVDVSAWADADGSPEPLCGFVHDGRVWVVLQRYDLNNYAAGTSVLIAIDPQTDTIIDLDTGADGVQGVDLSVKNVVSGALYEGKLFLAGNTYGMSDEGVIRVDLANPEIQTKIYDEEKLGGQASHISIFDDGLGVIQVAGVWPASDTYLFNAANGSFGDKLDVPAGNGVARAGSILYIGSRDDAKPGIYRFDISTKEQKGHVLETTLPPSALISVVY